MILIMARSGQMCNQLMTLLAGYAIGLRYGENVTCPIVDEHWKKYFRFSSESSPIKMELYNTPWLYCVIYILNRALSLLRIRNFFFRRKYNPNRHGKLQVFFDAFWHKEDSAIIENLEECQRFFAFKPEIVERNENYMCTVRKGSGKIVAVHARRGDYRKFLGGKFYFSDDELAFWMKGLRGDSPVRFIFFSNEKIDLEYYKKLGFDVIQSDGDAIDDLCRMSKCDYIMGPDSTYSWWAMVMGHKPRLNLSKGHGVYDLSDFTFYENCSYLRG